MLLKDFVSWLATVSTILLLCTGIPISRKIIRKGNSGDVTFFPLMLMFFNGVLWLKYGLLKQDSTLICVNGVSAVLGLAYTCIYYVYTLQKTSVHRQIAIGCALTFPMLIYVKMYAEDRDRALFFLGFNCSTNGVISYGAPLTAMAEVLRTKSTETMAFPLSLGNFIVALEWMAYGFLLNDLYILVPNSLGFVLSCIQLVLFYRYPSKKSSGTIMSG